MWMVMEASYKPREKRVGNIVVNLERGQLATSIRFMCQAWDWSKSRVARYIKRLENRDMIGTDSGTGINVITVCKYDDYQNLPNFSGTQKEKKRDSSGTAAGQQRDKPNKGLIPDVITSTQEAEDYQRFLEAHPKPFHSSAGAKAFTELVASGENPKTIIAAARAYSAEIAGWSNQGKVQRSDNFLDPERGKWRGFIPPPKKPTPSRSELVEFWAKSINENKFVAPSSVTPSMAREMVDAGLVTLEKLKSKGIAA